MAAVAMVAETAKEVSSASIAIWPKIVQTVALPES
jgi:hypothetical protein